MKTVNEEIAESELRHEQCMAGAIDLARAFIASGHITPSTTPKYLGEFYTALDNLRITSVATPAEPLVPAVPVKKSIQPDHIVCLEDGKSFKSLKRHLQCSYGLTPDQYRAKWGLPAEYPMVAPNYAAQRSELAKTMGLGRKRPSPPVAARRVAGSARA